MTYWKLIATSLFTLCVCYSTHGQDVEEQFSKFQDRLNNDPLRISGSFNASAQLYQAFQIENRALPFTGRIMAAMNFDFLGFQMPLSLAYSNGGVIFNKRLPSFSFIGISPTYKWAKLLVGTRTLDFGKYTFSNHSFSGIGFELSPKNWQFSSFYGRLRRARVQDLQGFTNIDPYYRRWGFGSKVAYEKGRDKVGISIFKAWDDENSIPQPDSVLNFDASENVILSGQISKGIGERLDLEVEFAHSGFTAERSQRASANAIQFSNFLGLLSKNISTRYNNAFESKLKYKMKKITLDLTYERIDPGYRTMGALFFNNDLENISAGLGLKFFKGRLNVIGRSGLQRNNLQEKEANDYERFVGSLNINLLASKKFSISGQVSNFNIANRRISILDPTSPVIFTNLVVNNSQASLNANYVLINNNSRASSVLLTANFAQGNTVLNDDIQEDQSSTFRNLFAMYSFELKPLSWSFNISSTYSENTIAESKTAFTNLGFASNKNFLKDKLSLAILTNFALNRSLIDDDLEARGRLSNLVLSITFSTSSSSTLSFNSAYLSNQVLDAPGISQIRTFSEFRNTLNFQYRFNPARK